MLAVEVTFLTGRYIATAYNTRTASEWPPHPARLFSTLVSTHLGSDPEAVPNRTEERAVLEWLEQQGAPSICASGAAHREVVTTFVPVNDVALTDVDNEARQVVAAQGALSHAEVSGDTKAIKACAQVVKKTETALQRAITRAIAVPASPVNPVYGRRVLPDYRIRQPRTFPSVTPDDARVTYVWPDAVASETLRRTLDGLLRRVVRLGHSSSLVSMRLADNPGEPTWRPAVDGEDPLRVVEPGQLAALERAFERHLEAEPRVLPFASQPYTRRLPASAESTPTSMFSGDWLVLRRVGGPFLPMTSTVGVARAVRKALMSYADEPIPEILSGHTADGRPSQGAHLAIVPLPFIGHAHASGAVLGVALVLPHETSAVNRRAVYGAVEQWEKKYRREDEDAPSIQLNLGSAGELFLERVEWATVQASLRSQTWSGPARVWYSATPVALDRNPGDLRSRDPQTLAKATAEAAQVICRACERIELPCPTHVEILPAAPWAGAAKARHYPPFPQDPERTKRVLTHVRIEFEQSVNGPILLGAGRYVGLGLFRPEASK